MWIFDVLYVVNQYKLMRKELSCQWFAMSWSSCDVTVMRNPHTSKMASLSWISLQKCQWLNLSLPCSSQPFHTQFMSSALKSSEISFHSNLEFYGLIKSQFCTCHNNSTAMPWANFWHCCVFFHYCDFLMGAATSHITSLTIVYSAVYSGTDQRKHQSSALLAFVRGIHRVPVNSLHKGPVMRKMLPFDDVIISQDQHLFLGWNSDYELFVKWVPVSKYGKSSSKNVILHGLQLVAMEACGQVNLKFIVIHQSNYRKLGHDGALLWSFQRPWGYWLYILDPWNIEISYVYKQLCFHH